MNKIIERLSKIAEGDPWKIRDDLRKYIEYLKEVRDAQVKEKNLSMPIP